MNDSLVLAGLFFVAATLYASVGHAGASAYLAAMALVGVPPAVMRPTALMLNLFVATIVVVRFYAAGHLLARPIPALGDLGRRLLAFGLGGQQTAPKLT